MLPGLVGVGGLEVTCPFKEEGGGVAEEGFVFCDGEWGGGGGGVENGVRDAGPAEDGVVVWCDVE